MQVTRDVQCMVTLLQLGQLINRPLKNFVQKCTNWVTSIYRFKITVKSESMFYCFLHRFIYLRKDRMYSLKVKCVLNY